MLFSSLIPRSKPSDGTDFVARSDNEWEYILEAGIDPTNCRRHFPYGKYPRLFLIWVIEQIRLSQRTKASDSLIIPVPSVQELACFMGVPDDIDTCAEISDQIRALLYSRVSVRKETQRGQLRTYDIASLPLAEAVRFADEDFDEPLCEFRLVPAMYNKLINSPDALPAAGHALLSNDEILSYDVCVWLIDCLAKITHEVSLTWNRLYHRFEDNVGIGDFPSRFQTALQRTEAFIPSGCAVITDREGIMLRPCRSNEDETD